MLLVLYLMIKNLIFYNLFVFLSSLCAIALKHLMTVCALQFSCYWCTFWDETVRLYVVPLLRYCFILHIF